MKSKHFPGADFLKHSGRSDHRLRQPAPGNWFVSTNWTPAGIPASGDNVLLNHKLDFNSTNSSQSEAVNYKCPAGLNPQIESPKR